MRTWEKTVIKAYSFAVLFPIIGITLTDRFVPVFRELGATLYIEGVLSWCFIATVYLLWNRRKIRARGIMDKRRV